MSEEIDDESLIPEEELKIAKFQEETLGLGGKAQCATCEVIKTWRQLYRCLYCKRYFCVQCGELHFGQTRLQWAESKKS